MLGRENRLQSAAEFREVYRNGEAFAGRFVILYLMKAAAGKKAGVVVSRKVGSAVERNRVKRIIREALRRGLAQLRGGVRIVVRARAAAGGAVPGELSAEVSELLALAGTARHSTG